MRENGILCVVRKLGVGGKGGDCTALYTPNESPSEKVGTVLVFCVGGQTPIDHGRKRERT